MNKKNNAKIKTQNNENKTYEMKCEYRARFNSGIHKHNNKSGGYNNYANHLLNNDNYYNHNNNGDNNDGQDGHQNNEGYYRGNFSNYRQY